MKQLIFLTLCATLTLFSACKKNDAEVDARDQFLGTWKGTLIPIIGQDVYAFERLLLIKKTDNSSNKITLTDLNDKTEITGTVNGKTVTLDQWVEKREDKNSSKYTFTYSSGTGNVCGTSLAATGTLSLSIDGVDKGKGTWSCVWTKQ